MSVYLVGYAKSMLYSEQPTVLLARRQMLLANFENLNSISNTAQETRFLLSFFFVSIKNH